MAQLGVLVVDIIRAGGIVGCYSHKKLDPFSGWWSGEPATIFPGNESGDAAAVH